MVRGGIVWSGARWVGMIYQRLHYEVKTVMDDLDQSMYGIHQTINVGGQKIGREFVVVLTDNTE